MIKLPKLFLFLSMIISGIEAYNILVVAPSPNLGQWFYMEEFIREMMNRGHLVTSIGCYGTRAKHPLLTEIFVRVLDVHQYFPSKNVYGGMYTSETQTMRMRWELGLLNTEHILSTPAVKQFIEDTSKKFDLVVVDQSCNEAMYLFAHKFRCPLVTIAHLGYTTAMDQTMGLSTPLSFVPHSNLPYSNDMTFVQRIYNTFITSYDSLFRRISYIRGQNKLAKKYFSRATIGEIPHVTEMEKRISVMLVNSHKAFDKPRPKMPGMIDIGGSHVKPPDGIKNEAVSKFINSAQEGVIYFSFGTYLKIEEIPQEKLTEIFETFKTLRQKVLLRANQEIPNLPENVMITGWVAQNDILAHPKVILFITHGGLLGVQEATGHAVPMLLIPFFSEQQKIAEQVRKSGCGKIIKFDNLTRENFAAEILSIIRSLEFKQKAMAASELFQDTVTRPMHKAMYWMEYAVRYNGASHLKSISVSFSTSKYFNYDVDVFYIALIGGTIMFWFYAVKLCIRKYQRREQKSKFKYY